jgi:hypothetical protein
VRSVKSIKLPLKEDGSIDWESTSEKHTQAFIDAIKVDPNGILQTCREESGGVSSSSGDDTGPSDIADATVLAGANIVMAANALGVRYIGGRFYPVLKNLHPVVAIKACTVTMDEIKPVMPAAKRIIKRYVPTKYIGPEFQDIAIVGEHLLKLSAAKFKSCIELAMEIEKMKAGQANKPNGRVVIDAEPTKVS